MAKSKVLLSVVAEGKNIKIVQGDVEKLAKSTNKAGKSSENLGKKTKSAETGLKGVGQQSANTTKNFSKSLNLIGGEGTGLVGAYAGLAANIFAVSAAFQFFQRSFDFANIIRGQESLAAVTGTAYKSITNSLVEATEGQLRYEEAAKGTAIGTAAGLNAKQLERLSSVAKNASIALGRDLTDSFNRLIRGVTKAEPELLDELGIILRLDPALRNYAAAIGKTKDQLTAFERTQAVTNEVLTQGERKFDEIAQLLDPDAFALQQFIRSFDELLNQIKLLVAQGLTPLFKILTENRNTLLLALTGFAAPIVRSILPDFKKLEVGSKELGNKLSGVFNSASESVERTSAAYKRLGTAQQGQVAVTNSLKNVTSKTDSILKIQAGNIENVSKRALAGLLTQARRGQGAITQMSKKMAADYIAGLELMLAKTTSTFGKIQVQIGRLGTGFKLLGLRVGQAVIGLAGIVTKAFGVITSVINAAFSIVSIVSLIVILKEAYDAWRGYKKGPDEALEAQKRLEEQTNRLIEKYKELNEELSRSSKARSTVGLLSLSQTIENLGSSVGNIDLLDLALQIEVLDRNNEEATKALQGTIDKLVDIDDAFGLFNNALNTGIPLTQQQIGELVSLQGAYVNAGKASKGVAESTQQLALSLSKVAQSAKSTAVDQVILDAGSNVENLTLQLEGASREYNRLKKEFQDQEEAFAFGNLGVVTQEGLEQIRLALSQGGAEIDAITKALEQNQRVLDATSEIREKIFEIDSKILSNELESSALKTVGISLEEKLQNIAAKRAIQENKILTAQRALEEQEAVIAALKAQNTDESEVAYQNAIQARDLARTRLTIAEYEVDLEEQRNRLEESAISFQKISLSLKERELESQRRLNTAKLQEKRISSQIGGTFGFQNARELRSATESNIEADINLNYQKLAQQAALYYQKLSEGDLIAAQGVEAQITALNNTIELRKLDLEISRNQEASFVNKVKGETELLEARRKGVSLNPLVQSFESKVLEARSQGLVLSAEQLATLRQQVEEQYFLNEAIQLQEGLYNSITEGMTNALTGLIDGTKSFKDAFKGMAVNILKDIASMISRMLVMRALMAVFQPAAAGPANMSAIGASLGQPQQSAGFTLSSVLGGRNGGVASKGKMMSGYASGGIATGSTSGYPAMLHGTEAIVPLPNGRSIPVEMTGSTQQNNVTVNVAIDNQGNATTDTSQQGPNIGNIIAQAVQKELQNQKRAGGILSPYGAA